MQKKVLSFIEQYHMIEEGSSVLAAVSGGADSLCMLIILQELQKEKQFELKAVHVEHGIRGKESQEDAIFVENFCKMHKIPCKVYHCKAADYAKEQKMTLEEGARTLRYGYFEEAAKELGVDRIAVAHNQNDCAETMLFHLARGTGLKGLCGIPPVRGKIVRPLLCVDRKAIEDYLTAKGQNYCTDATNIELEYTRNKIRHQVLPALEEINSQCVPHMNQTAALAGEALELLEELTELAKEKFTRRDASGLCIHQSVLAEKLVIQKALLHLVLGEISMSSRDISGIHIKQLQELFEKQVGKELHLPYGVEAVRTYTGIILNKSKAEPELLQQVWEIKPGETLIIPEYKCRIVARLMEAMPQDQEIPKKLYTKWFDYDKIKNSMQLRTKREKDFMVISADGKRKRLKNYLIDEKVPRSEREHVLLLVDSAHVVWAIGYRISEDVKVTEHTKKILEIQVDGGTIHE